MKIAESGKWMVKDLSMRECKKIIKLFHIKQQKFVLLKSMWDYLEQQIHQEEIKIKQLESLWDVSNEFVKGHFKLFRDSFSNAVLGDKSRSKPWKELGVIKSYRKKERSDKTEAKIVFDTTKWFENRRNKIIKKIQRIEKRITQFEIMDNERQAYKKAKDRLKFLGTNNEEIDSVKIKAIRKINKTPISAIGSLQSTKWWWFAISLLSIIVATLIILFYVVKIF